MNIIVAETVCNRRDGLPAQNTVLMLEDQLRSVGHDVDVIELPFNRGGDQLAQLLAFRLLTVSGADALIAVGLPACALEHPRLIAWCRPADWSPHLDPEAHAVLTASVDGAMVVVSDMGVTAIKAIESGLQ